MGYRLLFLNLVGLRDLPRQNRALTHHASLQNIRYQTVFGSNLKFLFCWWLDENICDYGLYVSDLRDLTERVLVISESQYLHSIFINLLTRASVFHLRQFRVFSIPAWRTRS